MNSCRSAGRTFGTHGVSGRVTTASPAAGVIVLELLAALALTGVLLGVVAALVVSYERAGDHFLSHHQAQLAAESYVECLRAGYPTPADTDRIRYEVDRRPGQGAWAGLTRVTVTAVVHTRHRRTARFSLVTYLPEERP